MKSLQKTDCTEQLCWKLPVPQDDFTHLILHQQRQMELRGVLWALDCFPFMIKCVV